VSSNLPHSTAPQNEQNVLKDFCTSLSNGSNQTNKKDTGMLKREGGRGGIPPKSMTPKEALGIWLILEAWTEILQKTGSF